MDDDQSQNIPDEDITDTPEAGFIDGIGSEDLYNANGPSGRLRKSLVTLSKKKEGDEARKQIWHIYPALRKEGATEQQAIDEIMAHLPNYFGKDGADRARDLRRAIEQADEEYQRYVNNGGKTVVIDLSKLSVLDRVARTPRYSANKELIKSVAPELKKRSQAADLLKEIRSLMGDKFKKGTRKTENFLMNRYDKSDLICVGETQAFVTATVKEIVHAGLKPEINNGLVKKPFSTKEPRLVSAGMSSTQLVASPMKEEYGVTKSGRETMKSRGNCGDIKYLVFEIDEADFKPLKEDTDDQVKKKLARMMMCALPRVKFLMKFAPLVDLIYSGSKSPHACFDVSDMDEKGIVRFIKLMMELGGDSICRLPEQFYRMGGAVRKTSRGNVVQTIYSLGRSTPSEDILTFDFGTDGANGGSGSSADRITQIRPPADCNANSTTPQSEDVEDVEGVDDFDDLPVVENKYTKIEKSRKAASGSKPSSKPKPKSTGGGEKFIEAMKTEIGKITVDTWDRAVEAVAEVVFENNADIITISQILADHAKTLGKSYTKAEVKALLNRLIKRIKKSAHATSSIPQWGNNYVFVADEDKFINYKSFSIIAPSAIDRMHLFDSEDDGYEQAASRVLLKIENFPKTETMDFRPDRYDRHDPLKSRLFKDRQKGNQVTLNTFHELFYPSTKGKATSKKKLKRAEFLIRRHLSNFLSDEDALTMLDWLAYAVQSAGQRMSWMPVVQSAEGCGKGLMIALLRAVTVPSHIALVSPLAFHSDYSDYNEGKIVIAYDEFSMTDKRGVSSKEDFKNNITEENLTVNRKGGRMLEVPNISKKIAFTNDLSCMKMSATDRRFCMIKSTIQSEADVARLNPVHFEEFCDEIIDPVLGHLAGAARKFLLDYDVRDTFDPLGRAPDTAYKRELVEDSKSGEYKLLSELLNDRKCEFVTDQFISVTQVVAACNWFDPKANASKEALNSLGFTKYDRVHGFTNAPKNGRVTHCHNKTKTKHTLYVPLKSSTDLAMTKKGAKLLRGQSHFADCSLEYEYDDPDAQDDFDKI